MRPIADATRPAQPQTAEARVQAQRIIETINVALPSSVNHRVLTFTSAIPGEGVSTVVWTLARLLAREPLNRVLYVDANVASPHSKGFAGETPSEGFVSFLLSNGNLEAVVRRSDGDRIAILPAGRAAGAQVGAVMDVQVEKGLDLLRGGFNYVLIDAAPPSISPFTLLLTRHSDGVLLVTESGSTSRDAVAQTVEQVRKNAQRLLGIVLNRKI